MEWILVTQNRIRFYGKSNHPVQVLVSRCQVISLGKAAEASLSNTLHSSYFDILNGTPIGATMNETKETKEYFAYRQFPQRRGTPVYKVEILAKVKPGKRRIRFVEGKDAGQEQVVSAQTILVRWNEAEAYVRDEQCLVKLLEKCESQWSHNQDDPVADAVNLVFGATGENEPFLNPSGSEAGLAHIPIDCAKRILSRAKMPVDPLELDPTVFIDRKGIVRLPFETAVQVAKAFAVAEPETVLISADAKQRKWENELTEPYEVELLQNWRAGWMLAREWAKGASGVANRSLLEMRHDIQNGWDELWKRFAQLEETSTDEIQRLRGLVLEATQMLRSKGAEKEADRLLLRLNQPSKERLKGSDRSTKE